MTRDASPIGIEDLSSYLDGELDETQRAAVESYLANHPEITAQVAEYRRRDDALRLAFAELCADQAHRPRRRISHAGSFGKRRIRLAVAAAMLGLVLGTGGWWYGSTMLDDRALTTLAREAIEAHVLYANSPGQNNVIGADREQVSARLSALLGVEVTAPNLSTLGLRLVGMRELHADSGAAALLVYEDGDGHDVSCYLKRLADSRGSDFMQTATTRINVIYRLDEQVGYAVVSALPVSRLWKIAEVGYREVSKNDQ